jgi:hypothetical protein
MADKIIDKVKRYPNLGPAKKLMKKKKKVIMKPHPPGRARPKVTKAKPNRGY